ncbi:MAG: TetR/AcrR family transcriptional regulator [Pseudomonadota bacterium]
MTKSQTLAKNPEREPGPADRWWHFWRCEVCESTAEDTRQKLLQAAFEEIYRVGFQAASLHNILKNTGVTKGALYHYFPNKHALGYAVVDEIVHGYLRSEWLEPLAASDDPVETLKRVMKDSAGRMTPEDVVLGCPLNNLSQEMSPVDEGFRARLENIYAEWRSALVDALERGVRAGTVSRAVEPQRASVVIVAALEGCIGQAKNAQSGDLLARCGAGLMDYLDTLKA